VIKIFEELDYQQTPIGDITLRRKRVASLGDLEVYEVKLDEAFLMSSMFHAVEDALADLGLAELAPGDWDVVVGGLGLGYTALAALQHKSVRSLVVIDLLDAVISWHQRGMVPLGPKLTGDPRCRLQQGDFFALAVAPQGFDAGRKFHAILLDIDHSPSRLLHDTNAAFYSVKGLAALASQLHPDGVFAMWSDDPPDGVFLQLLHSVFTFARAEVVTFPNPLIGEDSASTVYVARRPLAAPQPDAGG
jgi:spermidine synthase